MPTVRLSDSTNYILIKFEHVRGRGSPTWTNLNMPKQDQRKLAGPVWWAGVLHRVGLGSCEQGKAEHSMVEDIIFRASLYIDRRYTWLKTLPSWSTRVTDYQSAISTLSYLNYNVTLSSLPSLKCQFPRTPCLSPKNFYIYRHIEPLIERQ